MSMLWILCPLILIAGMVDAIAGGGGLISLTAYYAVGLPPHLALGNNKFSSLWGTAVACWRYIRSGHVKWNYALLSAAGALAGSALGAKLSLLVDERYLQLLLVVVVPALAIFILWKPDFGRREHPFGVGMMVFLSIVAGFVTGCYDGFFGPGAGMFMTLAFTAVLGLDMVTASGNARLVNLSSNLAALVTFVIHGNVNYAIGIPCAICGILGNYIGSGMAIKEGSKVIRPVMLVVLFLLLLKIVLDLFF